MVMHPRTHPRGAAPDFTLPRPNPNPRRVTDALWWLVCMREALEPSVSENGGTYARKPGYHNIGAALPDHGPGDRRTDHSIRRAPDRTGPWWRSFTAAHDWTFRDAQHGDYTTITKYTRRLVKAMRDPDDTRPDHVYAYTLGQIDADRVVEGYNEYRDEAETSGDTTHNWHRHDSFRRNVVGSFAAMWKALTIDMGWTYAEWRRSVTPQHPEDYMPLTNTDADVVWKRDIIPNPRQRGDSRNNPATSAFFAVGDLWQQVYDLRDAIAAQGRSLLAAVQALATKDTVDENALAAALAPGVAAAVVAALPADRDDITVAELKEAVTGALREMLKP